MKILKEKRKDNKEQGTNLFDPEFQQPTMSKYSQL